MAPPNEYTIWQWNCRGFRRKRGNLQQFVKTKQAPDVIALQETGGTAKLSGYKSYSTLAEKATVTTLIHRNITAVEHDTGVRNIDHVLLEILPSRKKEGSLFVLNVYSPPRQKVKFGSLFRKVLNVAGRQALIVVGDFNAPHAAWGYTIENVKGRNLWNDAQHEELTLITNPQDPTRMGNSVSRDTTPDLTFIKNISNPHWTNTNVNLGSDHYIVCTILQAGPRKKKGRKIMLTEWDTFRKIREDDATETIEDIQKWTDTLQRSVQKATKHVPEEAGMEEMDSKLLHMWEAKRSLQERWKGQKHNRRLRKRIVALDRDIEDYANRLSQQQWAGMCTLMNRQFGMSKTWNIIRGLLDPEGTKTTQRQNLQRILHSYAGTEAELLRELRQTYVGDATKARLPEYEGKDNVDLDASITEAEIRYELGRLNPKSAPGPDGITNKTLRNLDDESVTALTKYINECWEKGAIPQQWKTAKIILIPKPGKKPLIGNLRPISLTSCIGKLMEKVILTRLVRYMDDNELYPHTMIGFRPRLSTQDVMLQLKNQIIDAETHTLDTKAILGLDLQKAFDNVTHEAILRNLQNLHVGRRVYDYIKDFLTNRKATITAGEAESEEFVLGNKGTPQGSVLSPFLFNVAMLGLPSELERVEGLQHSIYADDITLWVTGGSDGHIEEILQQAVNTVERYVENNGLKCSPQKSELLLYRPTSRGRKRIHERHNITILAGGYPIPQVQHIRVLGLRISENGHNGEAIKFLDNNTQQTIRMIRRIANKNYGVKEHNLVQLIQAFVVSRIVYVTPYLKLQVAEKQKIECIIKKAYKQALGLPITTSNEKFEALGMHNTLDELIEAHMIAQYERLAQSNTGRHILHKLAITYAGQSGNKYDIPKETRERIIIPPLPRNMHPEHHRERRNARARALHKKFQHDADVVYVDAAEYTDGRHMAIVASNQAGHLLASGTIKTGNSEIAEETAIALTLASTRASVVISDSKTAIHNFANGRVSKEALRILNNFRGERDVYVIWTPAHSSLPGNETAHTLARELASRAGAGMTRSPRAERDRMFSYNEITKHYRLGRQHYPPPHSSLNKQQATAWRLLQTNTFPNPIAYNHCYPDLYSDRCKHCNQRADLKHIIWACPNIVKGPNTYMNTEQWETALLSSSIEDQLQVIRQAEDAARAQGLLAAI